MSSSARHHRYLHAIAIEGVKRISLADENRFVAAVRNKRVVAITFAFEDAFHNVLALRFVIVTLAVRTDVIIKDKRVQRIQDEHLRGVIAGAQF